jgi:hypothetical protein
MSSIYVDEILPSTAQYLRLTQNGVSTPLYAKEIGEIIQLRNRKSTSLSFPYFLLSTADTTISATNYPDYVEYLRNIKVETFLSSLQTSTATVSSNTTLTLNTSTVIPLGSLIYFHTTGSLSGQFRTVIAGSGTSYTLDELTTVGAGTAYSILNPDSYISSFSGSWVSSEFTFSNTISSNRIIFESLLEDILYSGAVASTASTTTTWTLPNNTLNNTYGLGIIRANGVDLIITSLKYNSSGDIRSITTSSAGSGTTIEIYPHRTSISTIARHKQVEDSVLINNGMQVVNGLRLRDRFQKFVLQVSRYNAGTGSLSVGSHTISSGVYPTAPRELSGYYADEFISDGTNGTPRTGQFTRPRGLGVYFYEYVGRVLA